MPRKDVNPDEALLRVALFLAVQGGRCLAASVDRYVLLLDVTTSVAVVSKPMGSCDDAGLIH
ncbi:hypothetical protein GCM10020219_041040 [Nonomuraea dietziae]